MSHNHITITLQLHFVVQVLLYKYNNTIGISNLYIMKYHGRRKTGPLFRLFHAPVVTGKNTYCYPGLLIQDVRTMALN